jgi:ParB-like chromosome segregation protein Spo0J
VSEKKTGAVILTGDKTFPLIDFDRIEPLPKPIRGKKQVLLNPRGSDKYTREHLANLIESIQIDGLQQPPIVRVNTEQGKVVRVQLLGGNGRWHAIKFLIDEDAWVYDDKLPRKDSYRKGEIVVFRGMLAEVIRGGSAPVIRSSDFEQDVPAVELLPTVKAAKKYGKIPCKAAYDIDDWQAMRLSFSENNKRRDLTVAEEIDLVEYYLAEGFSQEEICTLIDKKATWVSHTANFRKALPKDALEALLAGNMVRDVATKFLSYPEDVRDKLFAATYQVARAKNEKKLAEVEDEQYIAEDMAADFAAVAHQAISVGDTKAAAKAVKESEAAEKAAKLAKQRKEQAKKNVGKITQSDLVEGAQAIGVRTKKPKPLTRHQIQGFVELCTKYIKEGVVDPFCGETVPTTSLKLVRAVAEAILTGESDPLVSIRDLHVALGKWSLLKKLDEIDGPSDDVLDVIDEDLEDLDYDGYEESEEFMAEYR